MEQELLENCDLCNAEVTIKSGFCCDCGTILCGKCVISRTENEQRVHRCPDCMSEAFEAWVEAGIYVRVDDADAKGQ